MNDILSVYECSLSSEYSNRCWGHLNLTCYNQIYLNFEFSGYAKTLLSRPCTLVPKWDTQWNFHYPLFLLVAFPLTFVQWKWTLDAQKVLHRLANLIFLKYCSMGDSNSLPLTSHCCIAPCTVLWITLARTTRSKLRGGSFSRLQYLTSNSVGEIESQTSMS